MLAIKTKDEKKFIIARAKIVAINAINDLLRRYSSLQIDSKNVETETQRIADQYFESTGNLINWAEIR